MRGGARVCNARKGRTPNPGRQNVNVNACRRNVNANAGERERVTWNWERG